MPTSRKDVIVVADRQMISKRQGQPRDSLHIRRCLPRIVVPKEQNSSYIQSVIKENLVYESILEVTTSNMVKFNFARWKHNSVDSILALSTAEQFFEVWNNILSTTEGVCIDIGAHMGDTTVYMAAACKNGKTLAFEMGPPFKVLQVQAFINPHLNITAMNYAITDADKPVYYESGCNGCNGGIASPSQKQKAKVEGRELTSLLLERYGADFIKSIKFIKLDTEGHDITILKSINISMLLFYDISPIFWVEWYLPYRFGAANECSEQSQKLFSTIYAMGYEIYKPQFPLVMVKDCKNKNYVPDLLLMKDIK